MKVDNKKGRLEAIELLKVGNYSEECTCCGKKYNNTDMWHCYRYGLRQALVSYWYCQNCMKSTKDVLNEIDTDAIPFGLAGVDGFGTSFKKDFTKINTGMRMLPEGKRKRAKAY